MRLEAKELEDMMDAVLELSGEWFEVTRSGQTFRAQGARLRENATRRNFIEFRPTETIQSDDILVGEVSGEKLIVNEVRPKLLTGQLYSLQAFYKTQHEIDQEKKALTPHAPVFNIGTAHGSIIGTQQTATIHNKFDFAALDAQIDKQGGTDTAELKAMIGEIREILTKDESVPSGILSRFSAIMERHTWIMEPVSHILILWGLGQLKIHLA